jgi:hypothetical protein
MRPSYRGKRAPDQGLRLYWNFSFPIAIGFLRAESGSGETSQPLPPHTTGHTGYVSGGSVASVSDGSRAGGVADPGHRRSCQGGRSPGSMGGLDRVPGQVPAHPTATLLALPTPAPGVQFLAAGRRFDEANVGVPPVPARPRVSGTSTGPPPAGTPSGPSRAPGAGAAADGAGTSG